MKVTFWKIIWVSIITSIVANGMVNAASKILRDKLEKSKKERRNSKKEKGRNSKKRRKNS